MEICQPALGTYSICDGENKEHRCQWTFRGLFNDLKLLNQRLCKMSQPRLLIEKKWLIGCSRQAYFILSFSQEGMHNSCAPFWSRLENDWKVMNSQTLCNCKTQLRDLFLITLCACCVCSARAINFPIFSSFDPGRWECRRFLWGRPAVWQKQVVLWIQKSCQLHPKRAEATGPD